MGSQRTTMLPGRLAAAKPSEGRNDHGLPVDLAEKACRRLSQFALMMTAIGGLVMLLSRPVWQDHPDATELLVVRVMQILTVVLSLSLWLIARSDRLPRSTVLDLGLVYEVIYCLTVSIGYNWFTGSTYGVFASMTIVCVIIAIYPMIIPSPPGKTLLAALASALTAPLGIYIVASMDVAAIGLSDYLGVSIYPAVCVGLAVFGSRIIHGLNIDVATAQNIGRYRLEERIGKGGMGEVWRAKHELLVRPAAIKLIRPDAAPGRSREEEDRLLQRFEREAQVTASLKSPHTVDLFDFGRTDDGSFYYVMELLDGIDLERLVERFGPVVPERAVKILSQICHSLAEAHDQGLVHRDIKPANILACRYGRDLDFVKVLDFGLVSLAPRPDRQDLSLTADGVVGGTPAYMAPELVNGGASDRRTDIYALGCVAFWLLTGRLVFGGNTAMKLLIAHSKEQAPAPSEISEQPIPEALDRAILACLAKQPGDRPQSGDELIQALEACPMERAWDVDRARRWWERHRPETVTAPQARDPSEE